MCSVCVELGEFDACCVLMNLVCMCAQLVLLCVYLCVCCWEWCVCVLTVYICECLYGLSSERGEKRGYSCKCVYAGVWVGCEY